MDSWSRIILISVTSFFSSVYVTSVSPGMESWKSRHWIIGLADCRYCILVYTILLPDSKKHCYLSREHLTALPKLIRNSIHELRNCNYIWTELVSNLPIYDIHCSWNEQSPEFTALAQNAKGYEAQQKYRHGISMLQDQSQ